MKIPPPPEWLEEWEAESGGGHPEARNDAAPSNCPQCFHGPHYLSCQVRMTAGPTRECGCPGLSRHGRGGEQLTL